MTVARQVAEYLDAFGLAFKTYQVSELDRMIKAVAGDGARISSEKQSQSFENLLMQRGFLCFPPIGDAINGDGYFRVIRANSIIANLLNAFRYPGADGDTQLAKLLTALRRRRNNDDMQGGSDNEA